MFLTEKKGKNSVWGAPFNLPVNNILQFFVLLLIFFRYIFVFFHIFVFSNVVLKSVVCSYSQNLRISRIFRFCDLLKICYFVFPISMDFSQYEKFPFVTCILK